MGVNAEPVDNIILMKVTTGIAKLVATECAYVLSGSICIAKISQ